MPQVTSEQYSYNDMTVTLGGNIMFGAVGLSVEFGYEQEAVRGKGGKPQAINEKSFEVTGTISLLQGDFESLILQYGQNYQKPYFQVVWNFAKDENDPTTFKTHIITGLKLGKTKMELKEGDAFMTVELPFTALDIKLNQ